MGLSEGFDEWASAHWSQLLGLARVIAADPHVADDVLQDTLVDLYRRWNRIQSFTNLLGYAAQVMGSKTANRRRTAWTRRVRVTDLEEVIGLEATDGTTAADAHIDVVAALQSLNTRQREIIAMHYLLDMPVAHIAAVLERPVGSITSDLSRARQALRGLLDGGGGL